MNAKMFGIYIRCSCGEILSAESKVDDESNVPYFEVEPCEMCEKEARKKAYDKGYYSGREDGFNEGETSVECGFDDR